MKRQILSAIGLCQAHAPDTVRFLSRLYHDIEVHRQLTLSDGTFVDLRLSLCDIYQVIETKVVRPFQLFLF